MISLNKHSISTKIVDRYATTVYSFEFKNELRNTSKELQFELTVHPESFISNFTAIIDGETFNGITKEKQTASKEYKAAKEKNENAILISQPHNEIPNIFQIKTNIDSNSEVSLHITIEQYLTKTFNYNNLDIQILRSFKKYNIIKKYEYITFNINIKDSSGIFDIQIDNHDNIIIDEQIKDNTKCMISGRIHCAKSWINELTLKYKIQGEQTDSMILFDKNSNTFCHVISDIITTHKNINIPRRVIFVIDKSGSMSGSKWNKTTAATILALKQLRTYYDRFCVILFDSNMNIFPINNQIIQTNKTNVNSAIKWLQSKRAGGGTNINAPLLKAIELIKQDIKSCTNINYFMNQILFITDGEVSNTDKILINVKNANDLTNIDLYSSKISIFSFGISCDNNDSSWINDVNHSFLKSLSINNVGIYKRIKHSNTDKTLNEFFNILSKPILSNINIEYHNKNITNLTQTSFNTLYLGNDLIICGQFNIDKTETCELNVTATVSAITCSNKDVNNTKPINICKTMKMNIDINTSNNNHNIEKIWSYLKLKQLAEQRLKYDDMIEIDDDEKKSNDSLPLQLALKYHFITPWTSMIVVKQKDTNECQPINCSPLKRSVIKKAAYKQGSRYISNDMSQLHVPEQDTGNYDEEYEGWIWGETTQQWIEDPNWVDPNALNQNNGISKTKTQPNETAKSNPIKTLTSSCSKMRPADLDRYVKREQQMVQQSRSAKIDETNIPRVQIRNKVLTYESKPKLDTLPPDSRGAYIAQDLGNATPRHIRMTLYNIPLSGDTADKCSLALAAVIQPFGNIGLEESEIPIVNMGSDGPIRCIGCRGYMNPHVLWIADGTKWICNLCQLINECPTWYRKNLDGQYQRRDKMERNELHRGSVDYIAPTNLIKQMDSYKPSIFFVIDVSCVAYQRDLVSLTVNCIRNSLIELRQQYKDTNEEKSNDNGCILRVGFLTYDRQIHFHALSNGALHVISEVKDPFVSLPDSEILIPLMNDNKFLEWERLLLRIPKLFNANKFISESENKSCFGAALYSASQVLSLCGGKIIGQQTSLPNIGIGNLKFRDAIELHGTDKERDLYVSANPFYPKLTNECATNFISVDIFCCASGYCDLASIGEMTRKTGGQIYYYSNFNKNKDGNTFENDMRNNLLRKTVYRSVMAVRASKGLEVVDYFGNFFLTENQEIQLPIVTSDTALAVSIRHYEKLNNNNSDDNNNKIPPQIQSIRNKYASIQIAMLYLTWNGKVYIRVHTLCMPIVRRIADVFRCVDMDTVLNVSLKQCAQELISPVSSTMTVSAARKSLVSACVDILFVYRRYCASNNAQRQLVLPEALKLLPLFTLGLLKNPLLADGVQSDERAHHISYALHMPCYQSLTYIHPYVYPMHRLSNKECIVSESGRVLLPKAITLKYEMLKFNGLYVMDTGRKIYICIGPDLPKELFNQCFIQNKSNKHGLSIELKQDFDEDINDLGYRLSLILDELRYDKPYWLNIQILLLPNTKDHDSILTMDQHEFLKHLIEDASRIQTRNTTNKNPANMSYVDFLVYIHKEIQKKFIDL